MSTETSVPRQRDPAETALAELLIPQAPVGVALFGNDLRFTRVNAAFARAVFNQPGLAPSAGTARDLMSPEEVAGTFVGLMPSEAWPGPHGTRAEAALRKVLAESVAITEPGPPLKAAGAGDQTVESTAFWFPLSDGAHNGAALILTPAAAAEEVLRRREERYRSLVQGGAQVVWVAGQDGGMTEDAPEWRWITGQTFEEFAGDGWLESIHPEDRERVERSWRDSIRTGKTFDDRYRIRTKSGAYRHYDVRAVPIERDGRIVEWVGASTDVTSQREAEEMRGRLTEQLSAAALRTARLQQATSMLAEALTVEQVVEVITEVGRTAIGALRSSVALLEPDNIQLKVVNDDLRGAPDCAGPVLTTESPSVMTKAIQSRRPVLVEDPDELRRLFEGELEVDPDRLRNSDERSWVGLPLLAAGAPLGALRFSFSRPRRITEEERVFLEALAGQCSLAVERAAMYEREHLTAETLQRSLLPERLPDVAGLVLAASYLPVARNMEVGGDWYDAFWLADRRLAVAVGDVMGKGLIAAAGMGRVRNALRALALTDPRPAAVLSGL
ncbi:MAG TPA: PAS domain-containing protein, partial [Streptosporangiaceae bacterium]|nr:PAS domain-containing protein [Streptosporangiaceae bacterium]